MLQVIIRYTLQNFPLFMLILAILIPLFSKSHFKLRFCWAMFLFPVGLSGIWGFIFHAFYPQLTSSSIGWQQSPFEFEVALTNLSFGIAGIIASMASKSYRYAVALMVTIILWGAAGGHIYQIIVANNLHPSNAGSILFTDIIIPIALWLSIQMVPARKHQDAGYII